MSWVRSIGVSRLAYTPDILSTEEIANRSQLWNASERNVINDQIVQGKPFFTIDYSVPSFIRSPVFEAYKLLPRDTQDPFYDQEVGYKPFTAGDTLSAVSFLSTFLTMNQDTSVLAAHNNLMRAMAFAMDHELTEEPPDSIGNTEHGNDFIYQPWTRYTSSPSQSIPRTKGLIHYRQ
eukprot:13183806-Heterocapsa_arctica.AAC.1